MLWVFRIDIPSRITGYSPTHYGNIGLNFFCPEVRSYCFPDSQLQAPYCVLTTALLKPPSSNRPGVPRPRAWWTTTSQQSTSGHLNIFFFSFFGVSTTGKGLWQVRDSTVSLWAVLFIPFPSYRPQSPCV